MCAALPGNVPGDRGESARPNIPEWLELPPQGPPPLLITTRPQVLPFAQLTPENFERLVLRLGRCDADVEAARLYGVRGQDQHGIDLYFRLRSPGPTGRWYRTVQCRNVAGMTGLRLTLAVEDFLQGDWAARSDVFIIATRASAIRSERAEAVESATATLRGAGIRFEIWDGEELSDRLRGAPDLVESFFGSEAARAFCPRASTYRDDVARSKSVHGRLIGELDEADAMALEVHQAVKVPTGGGQSAPALPPYLMRPHDDELRGELALAEQGSRVVLLVGGSSTGKTRACWEAIRAVLPHWRVWHPLTPRRPDAIVDVLRSGGVQPHTVIWLNEVQMYLDREAGEQAAAALHELLHTPARGPILVLGTIWPQHFDQLTRTDDPTHAAARQLLLTSRKITVPADFSDAQLHSLGGLIRTDARLRLAARTAGRRVSQFLAGAPLIEDRYNCADETVRAVVWAAMDARRLGHGVYLCEAFLRYAARANMSEEAWDQAGDDWFTKAIDYLTKPCNGVPGPLTRRRPRPHELTPALPEYRLADYLDQIGRTTRAGVYPAAEFWEAAVSYVTSTADLAALGDAARSRARYQRAAQLYQEAAGRGSIDALRGLAELLEFAGDPAGAERLYLQAIEGGNVEALLDVAWLRHQAGDSAGAEAAAREAVGRGKRKALSDLARWREEAGDTTGAERLYRQSGEYGDAFALSMAAMLREQAGNRGEAELLYRESVDRGNEDALRGLAEMREQEGDRAGAERLYLEAADRGHPDALRALARLRYEAGDHDFAEALYRQLADQGDSFALWDLSMLRDESGDHEAAEELARAAGRIGNPFALTELARRREQAGELPAAERLYQEALDTGHPQIASAMALRHEKRGDTTSAERLAREGANHGDHQALHALARQREETGDLTGAERLYREAVDYGDSRSLQEVARLREKAGDLAGAERIQRFGLNDDGSVAER